MIQREGTGISESSFSKYVKQCDLVIWKEEESVGK